jgi:uncharacterized membrane protein required for colicin V production
MGLDLTLGGLVLIAGIRGWLKGFVIQVIRLGGLISAVYVALPIRTQVKPYVVGQLPTMRPELLDRMLWWASAVVAYFVITGVASLIVAVARKPKYGIAEPNRGDQFAGFGLGTIKGLIAVSFLVAGLERYALPQIAKISWAEDQKKSSFAWDWNERYHPATRIWAAPPVQQFVNHVQKMGLMGPAEKTTEPEPDKGVQTASRNAPSLSLPGGLDTTGLDPEMARAVELIQKELESLAAPDQPD